MNDYKIINKPFENEQDEIDSDYLKNLILSN